jgi:hypothetical protein
VWDLGNGTGMGSQYHMKWFILESSPAAWLEILERYILLPRPVDTPVSSPPMSLNNRWMDVLLAFSLRVVHRRLPQGECGICWRTSVWLSFVKTVTGQPDFPFRWHSTLPEWRNFIMMGSRTLLLWWCFIKSLSDCISTFFKSSPPSRPLPYEQN